MQRIAPEKVIEDGLIQFMRGGMSADNLFGAEKVDLEVHLSVRQCIGLAEVGIGKYQFFDK